MKMKKQHLEYLRGEINKVLEEFPNAPKHYEEGKFSRADKVKDLQKRFCFDLFYAAGLGGFASKELYSYLHDDHIYTALKAVCPKVTKRYHSEQEKCNET